MGELSIALAIIFIGWIYTLLHPYSKKTRDKWPAWVVANVLFFGALITGILSAML